tara:strand:+ start:24897 stop:25841 length:945 start_codon:yes stop_codon:yes gene_type:complete
LRKVSCWGIGKHAVRNILPALETCTNTCLVGAWSRNTEKLSETCDNLGIKAYDSEFELLSDDEIDTIILCTPTGLHAEQGISVVSSGKNLWSEKSLFLNEKEQSKFEKISSEMSTDVCEMFMFLYHPQFRMLKSLLESGEMGKIFSLSARFCIPHQESPNFRYQKNLGGGALLDAGCYPVAASHSLFGSDYSRISSQLINEENFSVDIRGNAKIDYPGGITSFLEWGFGMSYANEISLRCEEGNISLNRPFSKTSVIETQIEISYNSGEKNRINIPPSNHFVDMFSSNCDMTGLNWVKNQSKLLKKISSENGEY